MPSGEKLAVTAPVVGLTVGAGRLIRAGNGGSVGAAATAIASTPASTARSAAPPMNRVITNLPLRNDSEAFECQRSLQLTAKPSNDSEAATTLPHPRHRRD